MLPSDRAFLICPGHRCPDLCNIRKAKRGRHDAGNQKTLTVDVDVVADNVSIRAEMVRPKSMTKNHHVAAARLILLRRKNAAQHWLNAQGLKEATRYRAGV